MIILFSYRAVALIMMCLQPNYFLSQEGVQMLKDEIAQSREMLKEKSLWAKFKYFCYYYWKIVLIAVIVIVSIICMIRHFIESSVEPYIYITMINNDSSSDAPEELVSSYISSRNIDTEAAPVTLDKDIEFQEDSSNDIYVSNSQRVYTFLQDGDIDVLFGPKWAMEGFAHQSQLEGMDWALPEDLYEQLEDRMIYFTYDDDGDVPIAIYVGDLPKVADMYEDDTDVYFAIGNFSENQETAVDFLRYLLEE
jgi:hypothetical protein